MKTVSKAVGKFLQVIPDFLPNKYFSQTSGSSFTQMIHRCFHKFKKYIIPCGKRSILYNIAFLVLAKEPNSVHYLSLA